MCVCLCVCLDLGLSSQDKDIVQGVFENSVLWKNVVVGVASGYELVGPGVETWLGDEIFQTRPDLPWSPPSLLYDLYRVTFPEVKRPGAWRWLTFHVLR